MYLKRSERMLKRAFFKDGDGDDSGAGGDEPPAAKTYSEEEYNNLQSQIDAMQSKNDELLGEAKKAKAARRQAEEDKRLEAEAKAKKEGDFEHLFKSSEQKRQEYEKDLADLKGSIAREKCETKALEIANQIANGPNEAMLLSGHIVKRLSHSDGSFTVLDASGNPSVMKMDNLKEEFNSNDLYSSLLKGNQSSGGGAAGSGSGGGATKTATREEFGLLNSKQKMEFTKSGGKITD
jgi:hypothetical protein